MAYYTVIFSHCIVEHFKKIYDIFHLLTNIQTINCSMVPFYQKDQNVYLVLKINFYTYIPSDYSNLKRQTAPFYYDIIMGT